MAWTETASIRRRGRVGGGDDNQEARGGFGSVTTTIITRLGTMEGNQDRTGRKRQDGGEREVEIL